MGIFFLFSLQKKSGIEKKEFYFFTMGKKKIKKKKKGLQKKLFWVFKGKPSFSLLQNPPIKKKPQGEAFLNKVNKMLRVISGV
ncbi:MAG: hypothetical protein CM15mP58_12990 [Burkholderiaceae bacterium]|nr:MAG: hypothetical protein CM15mP58_12990 [Burkholderiaceae bacterium]